MNWKLYDLAGNFPANHMDITKDTMGDDLKAVASIKVKPEINDNLKINNRIYNVCMTDGGNKTAGVREISFVDKENVDETIESEFTCPYCGYVDGDAFELDDEGECNCGRCNSELSYTRQVTIDYVVEPVKRAKIINIKVGK